MKLEESYEKYKKLKVPSLSEIREKASQHSKTSVFIVIVLVAFLLLALQYIPHFQVAQFNITNPKDVADAENSYRATLAQIFGGIAIVIGIYYTWRRITIAEEDLKATQENLKVAQESQITERFTRAIDHLGAVDQFGNPAIEIRLGGIYALERISNESEKDYWSIIDILTAYIRMNSIVDKYGNKKIRATESTSAYFQIDQNIDDEEDDPDDPKVNPISQDIQTILTILGRCRRVYNCEASRHFDLSYTYLGKAGLEGAHLEGVNLEGASLIKANLEGAHLEGANLHRANLHHVLLNRANLTGANLKWAKLQGSLIEANLEGANLEGAHLMVDLRGANLKGANLEGAYFKHSFFEEGANLEGANLQRVSIEWGYFEGANLEGANLKGAHIIESENLSFDQLSKVKTLYKTELDEYYIPLKEEYPALFEEPKNES